MRKLRRFARVGNRYSVYRLGQSRHLRGRPGLLGHRFWLCAIGYAGAGAGYGAARGRAHSAYELDATFAAFGPRILWRYLVAENRPLVIGGRAGYGYRRLRSGPYRRGIDARGHWGFDDYGGAFSMAEAE